MSGKKVVCEKCGEKESKGSVGRVDDPSFEMFVCKECYNGIFGLKPEKITITEASEHERFFR